MAGIWISHSLVTLLNKNYFDVEPMPMVPLISLFIHNESKSYCKRQVGFIGIYYLSGIRNGILCFIG